MSWHCSRALVEEFSEAICLVGELSAPSSSTPTPEAYYWPDKTTEHSRLSRFGMTSEPLMADHGAELLTWFREVSLVRTLAQPVAEMDLMVSEVGSGRKWLGLLARFDPDSLSWKTPQSSLVEGLDEFSETWPRWGSMRNGESWERMTLELPISENESGSWPTPTVCGNYNRPGASATSGMGLATAVKLWPTPCASDHSNRQVSENVHISSTGLPKHIAPNGMKSQMRLSQAVKMWRTPNASDANKWSKQTLEERTAKGQQIRLNTQVSPDGTQAGLLNPDWTEWLMGWPIGWTGLKPLATGRFQEWQQQHSIYSEDKDQK